MALITCVECGKEFSDKAEACPHCGCPTSESTKATELSPAASTEPLKKKTPVYGEPAAPSNSSRSNSAAGGAAGKTQNGCLTGCGVLFVGLILLAALGSIVGDSDSPNSKSYDEFDKIDAKVYCKSVIKKQLRDPDSYKFEKAVILSTNGQYGTAKIYFRSKNGFGGYVHGTATCTSYDNNGENWYRAVID